MNENKRILSKSSDKNLNHFILDKHLKIFSLIDDSKYQNNRIIMNSNLSKDTKNIKTNSLLDKNIKIKKNLSLEKKIKTKSNKSLSKYALKEKIVINCLDENQIKSMKLKEASKSSNKLTILDIEETSPFINIDRKTNYFNNQYKRTEQHSNSLKINQQSELIKKINKYIKEKKNPSIFLMNKKRY